MRRLSKSKLVAFRQCPKRLWLEVHRPDLREDSADSQMRFRTGHEVGELARRIYDPEGKGILIDPSIEGFDAAFARTREAMASRVPIFEAGFEIDGALAFADVLLPVGTAKEPRWRMVEVKSSTTVKDYHRDDIAIQAHIARTAGAALTGVALAHVDSQWTYPGGGDYTGLLREADLTTEALSRDGEARQWIRDAAQIVESAEEPTREVGTHCSTPFECGFVAYCRRHLSVPTHPCAWLPSVATKALKTHLETSGATEMQDVPDALLNALQLRVKTCTLEGKPFLDAKACKEELAHYGRPSVFLDFETITSAVPLWAGTRPYQQIPFQFSAHRIDSSGVLSHREFLNLSGQNPTRGFAEALVETCSEATTVFVYNATFEKNRIKELATAFPDLADSLLAINEKMVDLFPITRRHYYHPSQEGSWSIKDVLPAVAPDLAGYGSLDGVQDGSLAMEAFREAIAEETGEERKRELERQLLAYCRLDTYALVRLHASLRQDKWPFDAR